MKPPESHRRFRFVRRLWMALLAALSLAACAPAVQDAPVDPETYGRVVRLACVGDSLTAGDGAWPVPLAKMLGKGWEVRDFGLGCATASTFSDVPYGVLKLPEVVAYRPDVVVVLLGTNDSKPRHWYYKKEFERDYGRMLADLKAMDSRPRVWICLPPPAFPGQWGIDEGRLREMQPILHRVARRHGVPVIDLHGPLLGWGDHFPDQIHPDASASEEMARHVYRALTGRDPYP